MHIKGSGGFDAEKFQKLVAMLDAPSTGEVANAFRLAIAELKKRLKFIDQTGSSAEAIKVQLECEATRLDLQKELNTTKRKGASSDELKATIERLHRRISMLEEAASHASPGQPPEPDWAEEYMHEDPVQPEPPQQQPVQPKPVHETPAPDNYIHEDEFVEQDPAPKQHAVAKILPNASRPSTIGSTFIVRLKSIPPVKAFYLAVIVLQLWLPYSGYPPTNLFPRLITLFLVASAFLWVMVSTFRRYGKDGIVLKLCLFIDAVVICLTVGLGRDPLTWSIYHRSMWAPHQVLSVLLFLLAIAAISFLRDGPVYWLLDEENGKVLNWIVYPAGWAFVIATCIYFDPTFFGKAQKPVPPPAPSATHHTSHHKAHPVAFQIESPPVVYASDGSPGSSDDNGAGLVLWPVGGVVLLFLLASHSRSKARKERAAAQKAAHDFQAPNVHGNAGYASKSDVRKKGWL